MSKDYSVSMPVKNMGALKLPAIGLGAMGLSAF